MADTTTATTSHHLVSLKDAMGPRLRKPYLEVFFVDANQRDKKKPPSTNDPPPYDVATDAAQQALNQPDPALLAPMYGYNTFDDDRRQPQRPENRAGPTGTEILCGVICLVIFAVFILWAINQFGN
ncbi:MAG: hypothetical protein M1837_005652 [Sclerophora amabilis]|nr:MAG: hypothetical protein M1837_005652 [Sclerophora amabilis]